MSELFRIRIRRSHYCWLVGGNVLCMANEFRNNVDLPASNPHCVDLVAHSRPAANRFQCAVRVDGFGPYVVVSDVRLCGDRVGNQPFYQMAITRKLKSRGLGRGDKIYVEIEY